MSDQKDILTRMDALEQKLDLVLDYVNQQRLKSEVVEDLISDVSLIGKDIYNVSVTELEKQQVELDPDELRQLGINLVKNIRNFNEMLSLLDSIMDLKQDAVPIFNELVIEFTKNLHQLESKGYFDFARELGGMADKIVTHYSAEDLRSLSDRVVPVLDTLGQITRPEIMNDISRAAQAYHDTRKGETPSYSLIRVMREMNSPQMKEALGFMITLIKNLSTINNQK